MKTNTALVLSVNTLAFFLVSSAIGAPQDKVCEDLHRLTCTVGDYDDGTGSAANTSELRSKYDTVFREATELTKEKFQVAL